MADWPVLRMAAFMRTPVMLLQLPIAAVMTEEKALSPAAATEAPASLVAKLTRFSTTPMPLQMPAQR